MSCKKEIDSREQRYKKKRCERGDFSGKKNFYGHRNESLKNHNICE